MSLEQMGCNIWTREVLKRGIKVSALATHCGAKMAKLSDALITRRVPFTIPLGTTPREAAIRTLLINAFTYNRRS